MMRAIWEWVVRNVSIPSWMRKGWEWVIRKVPIPSWAEKGWEWIIGRVDIPPFVPDSDVFYVKGRYLRDNKHQIVVLRGVNLPLLDDHDFPVNSKGKIAQVEKSGANAVRIQWYVQYPKNPQDPSYVRPPYKISDLDDIIEECRTSRLIPIVELHDLTCKSDPPAFVELMKWWTEDAFDVLYRHRRYLIINLANEWGAYRWQNWSPAALDVFKNKYKDAITTIRNKGLNMPIMIDAPDCGTTLRAFTEIGQELIAHDPRHSLLLSVHSYWGGDYDGTPEVAAAVGAKQLPIVFGEIANKQEANGDLCYYGLDGTNLNNPAPSGFRYQNLLNFLAQPQINVGWLAWAWYKDGCEPRRITPNGDFTIAADDSTTGLTPYGEDILDNAVYGLRRGTARAVRTTSLPGAPPL